MSIFPVHRSYAAIAVPAVCALLGFTPSTASADFKYAIPESDITINLGDGWVFALEVFVTEDDAGEVIDVSLEGYAHTDMQDPFRLIIGLGADGLDDLSAEWDFDNQRAPNLSAVDDSGDRATRITHNFDVHTVELESINTRATVVIDAGLGDFLVQEGLMSVGDPMVDADGALALTVARVALVDTTQPVGDTSPINCAKAAVIACATTCPGWPGLQRTCVKSAKIINGECQIECFNPNDCCPPIPPPPPE